MKRPTLLVLLMIALAYLAGGIGPARADNTDRIIQLLDHMADSLREIAHRDPVKVVCECKS